VPEASLGIDDAFYHIGGDSLRAIRLLACYREHAIPLQLSDLTNASTIRLQSAKLGVNFLSSVDAGSENASYGNFQITPAQKPWTKSQQWSNALLAKIVELSESLSIEAVKSVVQELQSRHPALRLKFKTSTTNDISEKKQWSQMVEAESEPYESVKVLSLTATTGSERELRALSEQIAAEVSITNGINGIVGLISISKYPASQALVIAMHPCVVDQDSMNILAEDTLALLRGSKLGPLAPASFKQWAERLNVRAEGLTWTKDWDSVVGVPPREELEKSAVFAERTSVLAHSVVSTHASLHELPLGNLGEDPLDVLLAAVTATIQDDALSSSFSPTSRRVVWIRERVNEASGLSTEDVSRLVGPLAIEYPVSCENTAFASQSEAETEGQIDAVQRAKDARRRSRAAAINFAALASSVEQELTEQAAQRIVLVFDGDCHTNALVGLGDTCAIIIQLQTGGGTSGLMCWHRHGSTSANSGQISALVNQIGLTMEEMSLACSTLPKQVLTASDLSLAPWLSNSSFFRLKTEIVKAIGVEWEQVEDVAPTTALQRGMILDALQDPGRRTYVHSFTYQLGRVDAQRLHAALLDLIRRRSTLRSRFALDAAAGATQIVLKAENCHDIVLPIRDCRDDPEIRAAVEELSSDAGIGDFRSAPCRFGIFRSASGDVSMVWVMSHALYDGWSIGILEREYRILYDSRTVDDLDVIGEDVPFSNVARFLGLRDNEEDIQFWSGFMQGAQALPLSKASTRSLPGDELGRQWIARGQTEAVCNGTAKLPGVPLSTIFIFAAAATLGAYYDVDDVTFGLVLSGRTLPINGIERIVGPCINTMPCRLRLTKEANVLQHLGQFQNDLDRVQDHASVGLLEATQAASVSGPAITRVLLDFDGYSDSSVGLPNDAHVEPGHVSVQSISKAGPSDLTITGSITPEGRLQVHLLAGEAILISEDAGAMALKICQLVESMNTSHGNLSLREAQAVGMEERAQILDFAQGSSWLEAVAQLSRRDSAVAFDSSMISDSSLSPAGGCLHQLFEAQARRTPNKIALQYEDQDFFTYGQLDRRANAVAAGLHALNVGIGPGSIIPVCFDRSIDLVVALLAVLKAGAAYAPIDPAHPTERKVTIATAAGAAVVLVGDNIAWNAEAALHHTAHPKMITLDALIDLDCSSGSNVDSAHTEPTEVDLAYVIFTSGTTGAPKGCMIEHRNVFAFLQARQFYVGGSTSARCVSGSAIAFDVAVGDIWGSITRGGVYVMVATARLAESLPDIIENRLVTVAELTPTLLGSRSGFRSGWLQTLMLIGEPCPPDMAASLLHARYEAINAYGPAETTVEVSVQDLSKRSRKGFHSVPIGTPSGVNSLYVLGAENNELLPFGAVGELCVGGAQVGRGYLNDEEKTKAKFIPDPF
ncbi:hypothetical protein CF327_g7586, partial [Tilletia walkeri]